MDNVPRFKLAKVGEKKRRKGGGFSWFGGKPGGASLFGLGESGVGAAAEGATGLSRAVASLLAVMGTKAGIIALVATLGAGAFAVGRSLVPEGGFQASRKPKLFADKNYSAEDLAKVIKTPAGTDSLGMVWGSLDGKTPEQRAAEAARAKAEAEAAAKAEAEAQAEAGKEPVPIAGAQDPAALAAAQAAKAAADAKDKAFGGGKLGELSKTFGGSGLSGGAGLSGGVTRGFDSPQFKAEQGKLSPFGAKPANANRTAARVARAVRSGGKGLARRQLDQAHNLSSQARGSSTPEGSSSAADQAFNNNPGAGTAITGAGAGTGGSPGGAGSSGTGFGPDGSYVPTYGSTEQFPPGPDDCTHFSDGGYVNSPSGGCVKDVNAVSVDPTDKIILALKVLLALATLLAFAQLVAKFFPASPAYTILGTALMAIGGIIAALGVMLLGMGRPLAGAIFGVVGGVIALMAWIGHGSGKVIAEQAAKKTSFEILKNILPKLLAKHAITAATSTVSMGAGGIGTAISLTGLEGSKDAAMGMGVPNETLSGFQNMVGSSMDSIKGVGKSFTEAGNWGRHLNPETHNWE